MGLLQKIRCFIETCSGESYIFLLFCSSKIEGICMCSSLECDNFIYMNFFQKNFIMGNDENCALIKLNGSG